MFFKLFIIGNIDFFSFEQNNFLSIKTLTKVNGN